MLVGAAARMADSTTLLSICDAVHLVVTKTTRHGDTSLVSSHFLDWRQVLAATDSRCTVNVELMGIGQYELTLSSHTHTHTHTHKTIKQLLLCLASCPIDPKCAWYKIFYVAGCLF